MLDAFKKSLRSIGLSDETVKRLLVGVTIFERQPTQGRTRDCGKRSNSG